MPQSASEFLFNKSTGAPTHASPAAVTHRAVDIGFACPDCQTEARLFSSPNATAYYCMNGHKFTDYQELMARNPQKLVVKPLVARQEGHIEMRISLPADVRDAMQKRFGDKVGPTMAAVMRNLCDAQVIMIASHDIERISALAGAKIRSGAEIYGKLFDLNETIKNLRQELEAAKAKSGGLASGNGVVATFDGVTMIKLHERAKANDRTPSQFVEDKVKEGLDGGWW